MTIMFNLSIKYAMKHLLILLTIFCSFSLSYADNKTTAETSNEIENKKVIILRKSIKHQIDRSSSPEAEACYDNMTKTIQLYCSGLKETAIYILSSSGDVTYSDFLDCDIPQFLTLDAPCITGDYYLIINSPVMYAEGIFTVR